MIQQKLSRYTCVFFLLHCDNRSLTSIFSRSVQFFCISVHHDEDDNNQNSASNKPLAKLYKVLKVKNWYQITQLLIWSLVNVTEL